ncbi:MAG: hypothetical protein K2G97_04705 [Oscillospiraceae bacterium]|nr:hypothetical protein [Oscillospiraceae bacterium]
MICFTIYILVYTIHCETADKSPQVTQIDNKTKNYKYCVKDVSGKITVYEKDNSTPIKTLDTRTNLLPEQDRQMLSQGIYLNSIEELNSLLQDYDD